MTEVTLPFTIPNGALDAILKVLHSKEPKYCKLVHCNCKE